MSVQEAEPSKMIRIPVPKAGTYIEMDTDKIALHLYEQMLIAGGKQFLSRRMTKVTKENYPDEDERRAKALEIAQENLEAIYAGTMSVRGAAKEGKVPREVMKEARRMAREVVRNKFKSMGYKISLIKSSKITEGANLLLANDPSFIEEATAEVNKLAKRNIGSVNLDELGDLEDPKKVKAAEERRAQKTVSAKQASKVATRARPQA